MRERRLLPKPDLGAEPPGRIALLQPFGKYPQPAPGHNLSDAQLPRSLGHADLLRQQMHELFKFVAFSKPLEWRAGTAREALCAMIAREIWRSARRPTLIAQHRVQAVAMEAGGRVDAVGPGFLDFGQEEGSEVWVRIVKGSWSSA